MAVVNIDEIWAGRRGGDNTFLTQTVYTRVFNVFTDDPHDGAEVVLAYGGIPAILSTFNPPSFSGDGNVVCVNRIPEQNHIDPTFWQVRCEYTSDTVAYAIQEPPEISWDTELLPFTANLCYQLEYSSTPTYELANDNFDDPQPDAFPSLEPSVALVNAAGDPFDPPPQEQRSLPKLTITRNEAASPLLTKEKFERTCNSDPFQGYRPGQAFMLQITGQKVNVTYAAFAYWRVRYEIIFDLLGHSQKLINAGYRWDNGGTLQLIRDIDNTPFAKPTPLDRNGAVLAQGAPYVWAKAVTRRSVPWVSLALPDATK